MPTVFHVGLQGGDSAKRARKQKTGLGYKTGTWNNWDVES